MFVMFVRHRHGRTIGEWLEMVDYEDIRDAVRDAVDYQNGEYSGEVMGLVEIVAGNVIQDAKMRYDFWDMVREALRESATYRMGDRLAQWEADKHDRQG